jgi:hypothetical protein
MTSLAKLLDDSRPKHRDPQTTDCIGDTGGQRCLRTDDHEFEVVDARHRRDGACVGGGDPVDYRPKLG